MRLIQLCFWVVVLATVGFFGYLLSFLVELPDLMITWGRRTWYLWRTTPAWREQERSQVLPE